MTDKIILNRIKTRARNIAAGAVLPVLMITCFAVFSDAANNNSATLNQANQIRRSLGNGKDSSSTALQDRYLGGQSQGNGTEINGANAPGITASPTIDDIAMETGNQKVEAIQEQKTDAQLRAERTQAASKLAAIALGAAIVAAFAIAFIKHTGFGLIAAAAITGGIAAFIAVTLKKALTHYNDGGNLSNGSKGLIIGMMSLAALAVAIAWTPAGAAAIKGIASSAWNMAKGLAGKAVGIGVGAAAAPLVSKAADSVKKPLDYARDSVSDWSQGKK